jgi:hypothetical protein
LNKGVQDLAFAIHGAPDVRLSAVDGDEHLVEIPPAIRPRPSSSQLLRMIVPNFNAQRRTAS